jgi:hypothetical protein
MSSRKCPLDREKRKRKKKWTDDFIETHKGSLDKFKEKFYKMIPSTK